MAPRSPRPRATPACWPGTSRSSTDRYLPIYIIIVHSIWFPQTSQCAASTLQYVRLILASQGVAPSLAARISSRLLAAIRVSLDSMAFRGLATAPELPAPYLGDGTLPLPFNSSRKFEVNFSTFSTQKKVPWGWAPSSGGPGQALPQPGGSSRPQLPPQALHRPYRWHLFSQLPATKPGPRQAFEKASWGKLGTAHVEEPDLFPPGS